MRDVNLSFLALEADTVATSIENGTAAINSDDVDKLRQIGERLTSLADTIERGCLYLAPHLDR